MDTCDYGGTCVAVNLTGLVSRARGPTTYLPAPISKLVRALFSREARARACLDIHGGESAPGGRDCNGGLLARCFFFWLLSAEWLPSSRSEAPSTWERPFRDGAIQGRALPTQ